MLHPFTPASSVSMSVTTTSTRVPLPPGLIGPQTAVMITEALGLQAAFVAFGDSTVVAVAPSGATPANGYPILPGSKEPLSVGPGVTHVAAVTAADTATLFITVGSGI